jgi:hypothetical protein
MSRDLVRQDWLQEESRYLAGQIPYTESHMTWLNRVMWPGWIESYRVSHKTLTRQHCLHEQPHDLAEQIPYTGSHKTALGRIPYTGSPVTWLEILPTRGVTWLG